MNRLTAAALAASLGFATAPALAYDFIADVLLGNTVKVTNTATGETVAYKLSADNSIIMVAPDGTTHTGTWRDAGGQICSTFATVNEGAEGCADKPAEQVALGQTRTDTAETPDGQTIEFTIEYVAGQ